MTSTNITFFFSFFILIFYYYFILFYFIFIIFLRAHTLVINKSYSNEKLKEMNEFSPITNEYMNPNPWDNLSS